MAALDDVETQKNGFVLVIYLLGKKGEPDREMAWKTSALNNVLPIRVTAVHICLDDQHFKGLMSLILYAMGSLLRVRARCHSGMYTIVSLVEYGLMLAIY